MEMNICIRGLENLVHKKNPLLKIHNSKKYKILSTNSVLIPHIDINQLNNTRNTSLPKTNEKSNFDVKECNTK